MAGLSSPTSVGLPFRFCFAFPATMPEIYDQAPLLYQLLFFPLKPAPLCLFSYDHPLTGFLITPSSTIRRKDFRKPSWVPSLTISSIPVHTNPHCFARTSSATVG